MKAQKYTIDEIFEKRLLLLIPFYIFSHEDRFEEYEKDETKLKVLKKEYEQIKNRLERNTCEGQLMNYQFCTKCKAGNFILWNYKEGRHIYTVNYAMLY